MKRVFNTLVVVALLSMPYISSGQISGSCEQSGIGEVIEGHCNTHWYWNGSGYSVTVYCDSDMEGDKGNGCVMNSSPGINP